MRVDFHTHTSASDGALSPEALLASASEAAVDLFAITDHDTIAGFLSVKNAVPAGMQLIPGVELSCVWGGVTVHVVGLNFDPEAEPLLDMLARLSEARSARAEKIDERLAKRGMAGALEGARQHAAGSQLGRPHFARWMVAEGHVKSMNAAFDQYLGQGKVGDVKTYWPALAEVVSAIVESGGQAVLAHPLKYRLTRTKLHALCADFKAAGGAVIEVLNARQTSEEVDRLRKLAQNHGFLVSAGSDFHRQWEYGASVGLDTQFVGACRPIWELWDKVA